MKRLGLVLLSVLLVLAFMISCSDNPIESEGLARLLINTFVLCEGNYNSLNASLWSINSDHSEITGPIYWNPSVNPLGDTGQSIYIHNDKLYIVMNNSNTIETGDISSGFQYESTINVPSSGPRDIEIVGNTAYISCWYLNGILLVDINNYNITDTLIVSGLPEDLLYYNDKLYASITMNPDWSASDKVIEIDISNGDPVITNTFSVITGPGQLLGYQNSIYVASTYYDDNWNTYAGNSKIDLHTNNVLKKDFGITSLFGPDMTIINQKIYRIYNNGICPLTDSLTMDTEKQIGNYNLIYSMASNNNLIYFGISDYVAPDNVIIIDTTGNEKANFQVGALPGAFAFYTDSISDIICENGHILLKFQLLQNYPNPFNGITNISYSISVPTNLKLSIYNSLGQHVIDLVNTYQVGGEYSVIWNGIDKTGLSVANGLYCGMLEGKQFRLMKKMIYLK